VIDTIAIIPARGGSKGVPRKNKRLLNGKPLVAYSIEAAMQCREIERIILSSDDEEILEIGRGYGIEAERRPEDLSGDKVPVLPVVQYLITQLRGTGNAPKNVIILQPTNPFRRAKTISDVIKKLETSTADCVVTISEVSQHPYRVRKMEGTLLKPIIDGVDPYGQRQELPDMYFFNGSVIGSRPEVFMQRKDFYGETLTGIKIDPIEGFDIDTELEFEFAEFLAQKKLENREDHEK